MKYGDIVQKLGKRAGNGAAINYSSFPWDNFNSELHIEAFAISLGKSTVGPALAFGGNRKFD